MEFQIDLVFGGSFLFIHSISDGNISIPVNQSNNAGRYKEADKDKSQYVSECLHGCKNKIFPQF